MDDEVSPLENSFRRKMMWSFNVFTCTTFSRFCNFFGISNAAPRLFHWLASKAKLEGVVANIAGVETVINGLEDGDQQQQKRKGVVVYFHGGGFVIGSVNAMSKYMAIMARETGAVVVAVGYRLAPDHPYPAALDDSIAVTKAVLEAGNQLPETLRTQIDPRRVVLVGDSAGATLALATALELIREGDTRLAGVLSVCPWTQAITARYESYVKHNYLTLMMAWFLANYAGIADPPKELVNAIIEGRHVRNEFRRQMATKLAPSPQFDKVAAVLQDPIEEIEQLDAVRKLVESPRAWPLLADDADLAKLPRTLVQVCTRDPLRDEGIALVERAQKAGGAQVQCHLLSFAQHCEAMMASDSTGVMASEAGRKGYQEIIKFIKAIVVH